MAKDRLVFLISFAVLGIFAALMFRESPDEREQVTLTPDTQVHQMQKKVLIAAESLSKGDTLEKGGFKWEEVEEEEIQPTDFLYTESVEQWLEHAVVARDLDPGEKINRLDIIWPEEMEKRKDVKLSPGKIAVPLAISQSDAQGKYFHSGASVDLIFTAKPELGLGSLSVILLKNLKILANNSEEERSTPSVLLEMTPREAEVYSYAKQSGHILLGVSNNNHQLVGEAPDLDLSAELKSSTSLENFYSILVSHMIRKLFPKSDIRIESTTKGFIVAGKVSDGRNIDRIIEVLAKVAPGGEAAIVNLIELPNYELSPGKMAVPFNLAAKSAAAGFIEKDQFVNVLLTAKPELGFGELNVTLLKKIKVLSVGSAGNAGAADSKVLEAILEMSPRQSEIFSYAKQAGVLSIGHNQRGNIDEFSDTDLADQFLCCRSARNFNSLLVTSFVRYLFPKTDLKIDSTTKGYIVSGKVSSQDDERKVMDVLQKSSVGGKETVVNLMSAPKASVEAGKVAVPFILASQAAVAHYAEPGKLVDVIFTAKQELGFGSLAVTLLKGMKIIRADVQSKSVTDIDQPLNLLIEMTPRQAEVFAYAQQTGTLSLGLSEEPRDYDFGENEDPDFADKILDCRSAGNFNSTLVTHMIHTLFPKVDVCIDSTTKGFIVSGKVSDPQIAYKIIEILEKVAPGGKETVVDLMEVVPQQILICVKVLEVSRDKVFNLGVNWAAIFNDGQTNLGFGATFPRPLTTDPNYFIDFLGTPGNWTLSYIIDMLEQKGWGEVIAEPNLTTISGQTAEFFAGGEFPILIPQGGTLAGTVTVEYKRFGVILEFTPFVDLNGLITLHIVPEVSRIDKNNSVVLQGYVIPSLITRRADTTVKLWPGQCYAIAGLIQNEMVERNYGLCGFDRIPILGPLFRSKKFESQKTELMIVLTPYLVNSDREITVLQPNDDACPNRYCDGNPFPEQFEVRKTENSRTTYQTPKKRRKRCKGMCY